jgi:hypothetical protein
MDLAARGEKRAEQETDGGQRDRDPRRRRGAELTVRGVVRARPETKLGAVQGAYYLLSGLWPIVSYRTFEWVTGPKRERWLVKTVGLLTVAIGSTLVRDPDGRSRQTRHLAIAIAIAYGAIDVWYAGLVRRIRPVYLLDAMAEMAFIAAWLRGTGGPGR